VSFVIFVVKHFDSHEYSNSRFFVTHMTIIVQHHILQHQPHLNILLQRCFLYSESLPKKMYRFGHAAAAPCSKTTASDRWHKSCWVRYEV
jgi:hypothetical protein